jgi:hypothetical protein
MPKLSKQDIITKLNEVGVDYDLTASYDTLLAVLRQAEKEHTTTLEAGVKGDNVEPPVSADETVNEHVAEAVQKDEKVEKEVEKEKVYANPFSSFETKMPMTGKAHEMRKKLLNQPRVPVMIPLGAEEKVGATHQVTLNGYVMFIRKGQMVDVPVQVADVLNAKFKHQTDVRQHPLRVTGGNVTALQQFD